VGDVYDNAMAESFFATLECELLARRPLQTQADGKLAVFEFIEAWYNPHRRHSALGYRSPNAFERSRREEQSGGSAPAPREVTERKGGPEGLVLESAQLSTEPG
jgi:putative transposase